MLKKIITAGALVAALTSTNVSAISVDFDKLYAGGGFASNSIPGASATGFQFFAGVPIDGIKMGKVKSAAEVGVMSSGDFGAWIGSATGLWVNYVVTMEFAKKMYGIGRAGVDLGDDSGPMVGFGAGYNLGKNIDIRAEYVIRDVINSLQMNAVYRF